MQVVDNKQELSQLLGQWRAQGQRVALVPTMGNLHAGHLALVRRAATLANRVVASIYVNPTQFGAGEDFDRYPRTPTDDLASLERENCDLVFLPADSEMYPFGLKHSVRVTASPDLAGRLEGASRPCHFDGVVTVVARLFAIVKPDIAVFGEKDYQQLLVIRRMSQDLGFGIDVAGVETVREKNGLALSSRNAFLDPDRIEAAKDLNVVLAETARLASTQAATFDHLENAAREQLEAAGLQVDYISIRRADDLSIPDSSNLSAPGSRGGNLRVLAAVRCGDTRLIDNMAVPLANQD